MSAQPSNPSEREQRVNEAIAVYLQAVDAGAPPDREVFLAQYADIAAELHAFLADRERFRRLAGNAPTVAPGEPSDVSRRVAAPGDTVPYFGDYELLAEIARGGMGVVYKAPAGQSRSHRRAEDDPCRPARLAGRRASASTRKPRQPPISSTRTSSPSTKSASIRASISSRWITSRAGASPRSCGRTRCRRPGPHNTSSRLPTRSSTPISKGRCIAT